MTDKPPETMDDLRERLIDAITHAWDTQEYLPYMPSNRECAIMDVDVLLAEILTTHTITPTREPVHGTIYTYTRKKCRCDECREANAAYSREYRAGLRREAGKHG